MGGFVGGRLGSGAESTTASTVCVLPRFLRLSLLAASIKTLCVIVSSQARNAAGSSSRCSDL